MADTIQSVLVGGVAGFVSAVITYFSTRFKTRLELTAESWLWGTGILAELTANMNAPD